FFLKLESDEVFFIIHKSIYDFTVPEISSDKPQKTCLIIDIIADDSEI
ncbi:4326_t:CDS:1, partial [Cetraspora pellucida]